jgi:hypothetical protein
VAIDPGGSNVVIAALAGAMNPQVQRAAQSTGACRIAHQAFNRS